MARQGRVVEAQEYYEKALSIDDENPLPYNNLGQLAEKSGDAETAIMRYQQALEKKLLTEGKERLKSEIEIRYKFFISTKLT